MNIEPDLDGNINIPAFITSQHDRAVFLAGATMGVYAISTRFQSSMEEVAKQLKEAAQETGIELSS